MKMLLSSVLLVASVAGIAKAEVYKLPNGVTAKVSAPSQSEIDQLSESLQRPILSQRQSTIDWMTIEEYDADKPLQELIAKEWGPLTNRAVRVEGAYVYRGTLDLAVRADGGDGLHEFRLQVIKCDSDRSCQLKLTHLSNNLAEAGKIFKLSFNLAELGLSKFARKSNLSPTDHSLEHLLEYGLSIEGEKEFWRPEETPNPVFELKL